jgi:Uma2 family endonuclease
MSPGKHSRLQTRWPNVINQILEPSRLGSAFTELRCTYPAGSRSSGYGGRSLVPDITVFAWARLPLNAAGEVENQLAIYPGWTIEILSPDQRPI